MVASAQKNDYAELTRRIKGAGLLEKQPVYYTFKILSTLALLAVSVALLISVDNFFLLIFPVAVFWGFVQLQFGMLLHDSAHGEIFKSDALNDALGLVAGNFILLMSASAWRVRHNNHHRQPNTPDVDEDISTPFLAYSEEQALQKRGIARFIVKFQAFIWFPMITLVPFSLRHTLAQRLFEGLKGRQWKYHYIEVLFLVAGAIFYFGIIFYFLSVGEALAFITVNTASLGLYFGTIFATNHKGMPFAEGDEDFLLGQILTTRNIRGNPLIDFWMGCLDYQIEHHLFPTMSRNNLSKAQVIVKEFCDEKGIDYYETGFFESYKEVLMHFHAVGAPLRKGTASKA